MSIALAGVSRRFGRMAAVDEVSLEIGEGELVAFLGPSGSGKTTLLRLVAGLDFPDAGVIRFDGQDATALRARERRVGFVFQHYALFPHLSVLDNVAFGLEVQRGPDRLPAAQIRARALELLALVRLAGLERRYPAQLSGGQRQRVALARALAVRPRVLLLDEPFGALDAQVRHELRRWLRELHDELRVMTIFVTHDQEEALELADRVVIMREGKIARAGTPAEVVADPGSAFVFGFLGETNIIPARVTAGRIAVPGTDLTLDGTGFGDGPVDLYVRPSDLVLAREAAGLPARVVRTIVRPGRSRAIVRVDGSERTLELDIDRPEGCPSGTSIRLTIRRWAAFPASA